MRMDFWKFDSFLKHEHAIYLIHVDVASVRLGTKKRI